MMHRVFHVWEVGGPLPCLRLATHDSQSPKKTRDCSDQGMGQSGQRCLPQASCGRSTGEGDP